MFEAPFICCLKPFISFILEVTTCSMVHTIFNASAFKLCSRLNRKISKLHFYF